MKLNVLFSTVSLLLLIGSIVSSCTKDTPPVEADFYAATQEIIVGESIDFNDLSTGSPNQYMWEFPGGVPERSIEKNPQVLYDEPGVFEVRLTVKNSYSEDIKIERNYVVVKSSCGDFDNDGCDDCDSDCQPIVCPTERSSTAQFGGTGGDYSSFILPECGTINWIQIWDGNRIDRITMGYELKDGEKKTVSYGGGGGRLNSVFFFPAPLVRITGRSGDRVDQLQFHFADGTSSPVYGGGGGSPFSVQVEDDESLGGFFVRSGDEIDAIGFYFLK